MANFTDNIWIEFCSIIIINSNFTACSQGPIDIKSAKVKVMA